MTTNVSAARLATAKNAPQDLQTRVANRKHELIAEILEHKKNSSRAGAAEAIDSIKVRLSDLADIMKEGIGNDWANVRGIARRRLDDWLARC